MKVDEEEDIETNISMKGDLNDEIESSGEDNQRKKNPNNTVVVAALPTTKSDLETLPTDGWLSPQARFCARRPWTCFGVAFLVATVLSVIGLIVGEFDVEADNAGWRTRGTLIANRHQQVTLVLFNRGRLFGEGDVAWDDLVNNVQPSWESDDDDDDVEDDGDVEERLLTSSSAQQPRDVSRNLAYRNMSLISGVSTRQSLQDNVFAGSLDGCNVTW